MTPTKFLAAAAITCAVCAGVAHAQAPADFAIKDGDRVVFYGDSITEQRQYTTMAETYVLTRFPKLKVSFAHSGWSGDRVGGGEYPIDVRLKRDVLAYNPTVVTIMLGMNDGSYRAFDQTIFDTYSQGYQKIIASIKAGAPGVRITAIQPSPFDDVTRKPTFEGGYNSVLLRYGQYDKELAQRENLGLADFNAPVVAMLQKANAADPVLAQKFLGDRVHPEPGAHLIMAAALLKSWNAPALVTAVELDAAAKKVVRADNTEVTAFNADGPLTWKQLDGSLPFPINLADPLTALAVKSSNVVELLDQEPLKVTGLTPGKYQLKIDGAPIGIFTSQELAAGVNLATLATPMAAQAANVRNYTWQHTQIHYDRWRSYGAFENDTFPAMKTWAQSALPGLYAALDAKEAFVVDGQRRVAQPVAHSYSLAAQP